MQGSRKDGWPFSSTCFLYVEIFLGLCAPSKQAFPRTTHPRSGRCAVEHFWVRSGIHGSCGGVGHPTSNRISASESRSGILPAIGSRWGWALAAAGVGIPSLVSGIALHSVSTGSL